MRPGPHPWATNANFASGPDVGLRTKTAPISLHKDDGYHRQRRPAPDILNHQLNREYLTHLAVARMQAMNYGVTETTSAIGAGDTMGASCHTYNSISGNAICLHWYDGAGNLIEYVTQGGGIWGSPLSNPSLGLLGPAGAITSLDVAGNKSFHRVLCVNAPPFADQVHYAASFGAGAWNNVTFTAGAPGKHWQAIGCDCDTAGAGNDLWIIGDSGAGGTVAPVIWSSTNGTSFAVVGTITGVGVGEQIYFIGHSRHAASALGGDDAGNPTWLILTTNRACVSSDGTAWASYAHGFGGLPSIKSAAYSKTASRWSTPTTAQGSETSTTPTITGSHGPS